MSDRRLPVRPDLEQLKQQAKDLLRAIHSGDPSAIADLEQFHPDRIDPANARLADAQLVLARGYQASSWTRLERTSVVAQATPSRVRAGHDP
jgi:hypothetical protein